MMELFKNVMMMVMAVIFMAVLLPGGVSFLSLRTDVLPPASGAQAKVQANANAQQQGSNSGGQTSNGGAGGTTQSGSGSGTNAGARTGDNAGDGAAGGGFYEPPVAGGGGCVQSPGRVGD